MKKLFTLALVLFSALAAVRAQDLTFVGGDTVNYSGPATSNMVLGTAYCKNNTNAAMDVSWKIIDTAGPSAWEYPGFCDKILCYLFQINATHGFTLAAGEQGIMKIEVIGNCVPGTGKATLMLWNAADSANSVLIVPYVARLSQSAQCTATGISTVEASHISMYPNPVLDEVHLSLPSSFDNGQIDIYNMIGSKVYSQSVSRDKTFDLSALQSGLYVARISENGKLVATRKFTKAD